MAKEFTQRQREIMDIVATSEKASITAIGELLGQQVSTATLNRDLASLVERGYLIKQGRGRATCYLISLRYKLQAPVLLDQYFAIPVDARNGFRSFSFELLSLLREPERARAFVQAHEGTLGSQTDPASQRYRRFAARFLHEQYVP